MSANTKIEWADHTFNPWIGCTQVSPGCDHCYAKAWDRRFAVSGHAMHWGPGVARRRTSEANWQQPLKWDREAKAKGIRYRVFCASLADVFDNEVPTTWRMDLFQLIADTSNLDWLLLTKRIGNVMPMCSGDSLMFDVICSRVWLGATIVNQEEADRDIPKLLATPAAKRFLSMEPLLGAVDLTRVRMPLGGLSFAVINALHHKDGLNLGAPSLAIDWVIAGGESGPNARPMHPDWARSLRDQCQAAGVPFFFKQWGEWVSVSEVAGQGPHHYFEDGATVRRVGKKTAGRQLDGRTWDEVEP